MGLFFSHLIPYQLFQFSVGPHFFFYPIFVGYSSRTRNISLTECVFSFGRCIPCISSKVKRTSFAECSGIIPNLVLQGFLKKIVAKEKLLKCISFFSFNTILRIKFFYSTISPIYGPSQSKKCIYKHSKLVFEINLNSIYSEFDFNVNVF